MPSSAVICSLGEARAFVIVRLLSHVQPQKECNWLQNWKLYYAQAQLREGCPSYFDTMHLHISGCSSLDAAAWNVQRLRWIEGYAPSCDLHDTEVSIHHAVDETVHEFFSFVIDE